eukprot:TRINITY_DN61526_c0_g1_i1.p1 TRINITY_DN61526_c0_g1~~TRINITY_DN61526_c0_g1_i1.p1  ORF type:complete len:530 (-),score=94.12 TRINITY_DN61526_c0_g1_i1:28-1545(-)
MDVATTGGNGSASRSDEAIPEEEETVQRTWMNVVDELCDPTLPTDPFRLRIALVLRSAACESVLCAIIAFNFIIVVMDTDATAYGQPSPPWMELTNNCLMVVYWIELAIKLCTFRWKYFHEIANVVDFVVIIVDGLFFVFGSIFDISFISVSATRVFRLIRLARAFRHLRKIYEIKILLSSFAGSIKAMCCGLACIFTMMTVWSILGVQLLHPVNYQLWRDREDECERCLHAFSSVWEANISIFQSIVAGDSWGQLAIPIIRERPWTAIYFAGVLVTISLAMMNLILAMIVDAANRARAEDIHQQAVLHAQEMKKAKRRLLELCEAMDSDKNGALSVEEFINGFESCQEFADTLRALDIGKADMETVFTILDSDGSGDVAYQEFVDHLYRMKTQETQQILFIASDIKRMMLNGEGSIHNHRSQEMVVDHDTVLQDEKINRILEITEAHSKVLGRLSQELQDLRTLIATSHGEGLVVGPQGEAMSRRLPKKLSPPSAAVAPAEGDI